MKMDHLISIVDLGKLGLGSEEEASVEDWETIGQEISQAFSDIGFVYLKNHGIPRHMIEEIFSSSRDFFCLDSETKCKYNRGVTDIQGYTSPNRERLTIDENEAELRESYDVRNPEGLFPDEEVTSLRPNVAALIQQCKELSQRLLSLMAIGLGLEKSHFVSCHQRMFQKKNSSSLRVLFYPAVPPDSKPGLIRCARHTDYGTFTLLFQDTMGGLEVLNRKGDWVQANPIPDAILVNIGDLTQFWTNNKFRATEHRVLVPHEEIKRRTARQSVVCFVHPDEEVIIEPIVGESNSSPVIAKEHALKRFAETYRY